MSDTRERESESGRESLAAALGKRQRKRHKSGKIYEKIKDAGVHSNITHTDTHAPHTPKNQVRTSNFKWRQAAEVHYKKYFTKNQLKSFE